MDNFKYVQTQPFTLAGSGVTIGDATLILSSFKTIDGTNLVMSDFGTKGFMTVEPGTGTQEEQISFSGVTQNANGTATLTGIKTVLFKTPYTETANFAKSHPGGVFAVVSNTAGFYNSLLAKDDDETILGTYTFTTPNYPQVDIAAVLPVNPEQLATKAYVDGVAIAGAPNADTVTKGIVEEATQAEIDANTAVGGTGARLFVNPSTLVTSKYGVPNNGTLSATNKYISQLGYQRAQEIYAASAAGSDTYAVTLSPVPAAYVTGMAVRFKADVRNTGACTLNVNGLGAVTIKKDTNQDLSDNDIKASQIIEVVYDGANFQLVSQPIPTGSLLIWSTTTSPSGYLLCDGTAVSRATFAGLFAVVSTTYGIGDGATTFNLPNLKGRVPVGVDAGQAEFTPIATTGGEKTHTLTVAEMPAHTHDVSVDSDAGGVEQIRVRKANLDATSGLSVPNAAKTTGGGGAHNNLQPYLVMNYIIKI